MGFKPLKLSPILATLLAGALFFSPFLRDGHSFPPEPANLPLGEYVAFQPDGGIRRFIGETLHIDISFLWFENAATARVGLYEQDGMIYSTLEAETRGVVGFLTDYRKHYYKATFDIVDNGKRVRSRKFERKVIIGGQEEQTRNIFDYDTHTHWWYKKSTANKLKTEAVTFLGMSVSMTSSLYFIISGMESMARRIKGPDRQSTPFPKREWIRSKFT